MQLLHWIQRLTAGCCQLLGAVHALLPRSGGMRSGQGTPHCPEHGAREAQPGAALEELSECLAAHRAPPAAQLISRFRPPDQCPGLGEQVPVSHRGHKHTAARSFSSLFVKEERFPALPLAGPSCRHGSIRAVLLEKLSPRAVSTLLLSSSLFPSCSLFSVCKMKALS